MTRVAQPSEKVLALAGVFRALTSELEGCVDPSDPRVQVALLHVSSDIAMHTDTRNMGLLGPITQPEIDRLVYGNNPPCDDCGEVGGTHNPMVEH